MLVTSPLLALVLSAHAGYVPRAVLLDLEPGVLDAVRVKVVTPGDGTVAGVSAELVSDSGEETVVLTESDAWLHGAATGVIRSPSGTVIVDGDLLLTVYDDVSAALITFSGTVDSDGSISLTPEKPTVDIEVVAAELFPNADGSYDLGFDFSGADAYDIAYADVAITQGKTTTKAEVDFYEIGAVWGGELTLDHEGLVEVKTKTVDKQGEKLDSSKVKLAAPWDDGGYGVSALATDEDPLTSVALVGGTSHCEKGKYFGDDCSKLTVVSDGWTLGDTLPVDASVELDNGDTLVLPANSYQVATVTQVKVGALGGAVTVKLDGATATLKTGTLGGGGAYTYMFWVQPARSAVQGVFVSIAEDADGAQWLSVSAFAADPDDVPAAVSVALDGGRPYELAFDDAVAVVFAGGVGLSGDPVGIDVSGKVSLLGESNSRGRQKTLAKGKFYATLSRDGDGDLSLSGADKDTVSAKGDILIGGEPIDFELTTNDDGVEEISAPPAVMLSNGSGTRFTSSTSTQTQQTELL